MAQGFQKRSRHSPPVTAEERLQHRLRQAEESPEPWRGFQTSDVAPIRMIRGNVDTTTPSIARGGGFTVSKPATGQIDITFTQQFIETPTVIATAVGGGNTIAQLVSVSATTCRLARTIASTGANNDGALCFMVLGLQSLG